MLKRGMSVHDHMGNSPGGTPLYGLGMCGLKGYGSTVILVINIVLTLVISVSNRVWYSQSP